MELTSSSLASTTPSRVATTTVGAPAQPLTSTRGLPDDAELREVPKGWVARNGMTVNEWDGLRVSRQLPDRQTLGQVRLWFPMYYGASTDANLGVGKLVRELPMGATQADALRAARELSAGAAPAIAVVREAGRMTLRVALTAGITSPYATISAPRWSSFAFNGAGTDHIDGPGTVAIARFTNDALRAVVDGRDSFVNPVGG